MESERTIFRQLRALDRHELRRVLIFVRGLLVAHGDEAAAPGPDDEGVTYRLESVRCGKPGCSTCPHGPYWYAYYRDGRRLRSRYIGRELAAEADGSEQGKEEGAAVENPTGGMSASSD